MFKTTTLSVILLAVTVAGCADTPSTITAPSAAAFDRNGESAAEAVARPIAGRCHTTFAPIPFPPPPIYRQTATGTCEISHLGRTALLLIQDINFAARSQRSVVVTYTAANGDVLNAMNEGTSVRNATGVSFSATVTFTGGTGRFANATGQAHAYGTADFRANTSDYELEGTIAYGKDRGER